MSDDFSKFKNAMTTPKAEPKKEEPKTPRAPRIIKKALTSNEVIKMLVESINPLESTNPDDLFIRNILTANRGNANRNQTYQRNIIRMVINRLIELEMIK